MKQGSALRQGCGTRRFASEIAAEKALAKGMALPGGQDDDRKVKRCAARDCGGWHLAEPEHRDTIPPKVRALVNKRDRWCQMCGAPSLLDQHHRRPKQIGGDPRPCADCPCNLVRLCRKHHRWVHRHRREAEAQGFMLPAETAEPGRVSVMRGSEDSGGASMYPTCDGQWVSESPWTAGGEAA